MMVNVKNKKGTGDRNVPAGYSSWLDFWEKKKTEKAVNCKVQYCTGEAEVGGHVYIVGESSKEYIMPLCYSCNKKDDAIFTTSKSNLVPVTD